MNEDSTTRERSDLFRRLRTQRQPSQMLVFLIDHDGSSDNVPTTAVCDVASGYTGDLETSHRRDWFEKHLGDLHGSISPQGSYTLSFNDAFADVWTAQLRQLFSESAIRPVELPPFEKIGRIMGKPKPVRRLELLPGLNR